jgi:hypothetical protein
VEERGRGTKEEELRRRSGTSRNRGGCWCLQWLGCSDWLGDTLIKLVPCFPSFLSIYRIIPRQASQRGQTDPRKAAPGPVAVDLQ